MIIFHTDSKKVGLVIGDLHLGMEYKLIKKGATLPENALKEKLMRELEKLFSKKPKILVVLGDVKESIGMVTLLEEKILEFFFDEVLSRGIEVYITAGNHDGGLEDVIPSDVMFFDSRGFSMGEVGFFHGHAYPGSTLSSCKVWVACHIHPTVELRDWSGRKVRYPVWVKVNREDEPDIIVMPPFNEFLLGYPLNASYNHDERGPILKYISENLDRTEILSLDGILLGNLRRLMEDNEEF
ncbi:MAG: metallophosphoesterase [Candidatus Odinarchaeota archaeon]|nr:metallophosphoesterase [Candidatus Odinarchaeota archaeon]